MSGPVQVGWRSFGDALAARYACSTWRLPVVGLVAICALFGPLYLLRGMRLVTLCGLALVALVSAAVGFAHPFQTLAVAMFLSFAGLGNYIPGPAVAGLLALASARAAYDLLDGDRFDFGSTGFRVALAVLLAAALTSCVMVHNPTTASIQGQRLLKGLITYFAISQLASRPERVASLLLAIGLGLGVATLVVLRGLVAASGLQLLQLASEARFGGIGSDPNVQAVLANCMVAPMLALFTRVRGVWRAAVVGVLLLLIATVVLSQSRAGLVLLGLLLAGLLLRERRARGFALFGLLVFSIVALLLPRLYWVRFESIAQLRGIVVDRSLQVRQHVLEGGWQMFLQHPWLGVGLGNFPDYAPRFMLGGFLAHNSYLELAASIGIVGCAAYIALLGSGLRMARSAQARWQRAGERSNRAVADAIGISILCFAAGALPLSIPFDPICWVLLGLANAARRAAPEPTA